MKYTLLAIFLTIGTFSQAQKFGHLHSGELLAQLPEVKSADDKLKTLQDSLKTVGEGLVKKFETNYSEYMKASQAGILSQVEMQKKEAKLQEEQSTIQEFEKGAQMVLMQRRELLMKPILDRVNTIIKDIGKEGKYTYIFDKSLDALLFAQESEDISPMVRKKLGI